MNIVKFLADQKTRAYIYRVLVGIGILLSGYGYITANELAMWSGFLTTLLNIMPTLNTSTKTDQ